MPKATPAPIPYLPTPHLPALLPSPGPYVEQAATFQSPEQAALLRLLQMEVAEAAPTLGTAVIVTPPFGAETVTPKFCPLARADVQRAASDWQRE